MTHEATVPRRDAQNDPLYSEETVTQWLLGAAVHESAPSSTPSNKGPNKLNKHNALLRDNADCFINNHPQANTGKKKILISYPFDYELRVGELAVLSELIQYYEVYLWKGPEETLAKAIPLQSLADFFKQREAIKIDYAARIKASLINTKQQIALDDWIVLDKQAWEARWGRPKHEIFIMGTRSWLERTIKELQGADLSLITTANLYAPNQEALLYILKNFPNLHTLKIQRSTSQEIQKLIPYLQGYNVKELNVSDFVPSEKNIDLSFASTYGIKKLTLELDSRRFETIGISVLQGELELAIKNPDKRATPQIIGKGFKQVQESKAIPSEEEQQFTDIVRPETTTIETIEQLEKCVAERPGKEKALIITDADLTPEDYPKIAKRFPELKYLKILDHNMVHLQDMPCLENCTAADTENFSIKNCPQLHILAVHKNYDLTTKWQINFETLPNLKYLILTGNSPKNEVDVIEQSLIENCPEIEHLFLCDINCSFSREDLTKNRKLRELECVNSESEREKLGQGMSPLDTKSTLRSPESNPQAPLQGISFFSRQKALSPQQSVDKPVATGEGQCSALLKHHDLTPIQVRDYRIEVYDHIEYEAKTDHVSFLSSSYAPQKIQEINQTYTQRRKGIDPKIDSGVLIITGELQAGQEFPLPLTAPAIKDSLRIYKDDTNSKVKLGFYQNPSTQQYFIRILDKPRNAAAVKLYYDFLPDPNYQSAALPEIAELKLQKRRTSTDLITKVETKLKAHPPLAFLFDENLSITKKITQLTTYCSNFKPESEKPLKGTYTSSLDLLLARITQQVGVCAGRAEAFMLIAHCILGLEDEVCLIHNETHDYCDVRDKKGSLRRVDFGGGAMEDKATAKRNHNLKQLQAELNNSPIDNRLEERANDYENKIHRYLNQHREFAWKLCSANKPVLIRVPKGMTSEQAKAAIIGRGNRKQVLPPNFLCIDHPSDFARYWDSWTVQEETGKRVRVPGPLQYIFENGGKLLINWSAFSPKELIYFQSLWREKRWNRHAVGNKVQILGYLHEDNLCPFVNDCTVCTLPSPPLPNPLPPSLAGARAGERGAAQVPSPPSERQRRKVGESTWTPSPPPERQRGKVGEGWGEGDLRPDDELKAIHCYLSPLVNWEEKLLASFEFNPGEIKLMPGSLLQAIKNKCPLIIHNPPEDPQLQQLLQQINTEGRFYFNGQWKDVPKETTVRISAEKTPPSSAESPPWSLITEEKKNLTPATKICLHLNNWDTLYEEIHYNETDNTISSRLGKLAQYANKPQEVIFYITQEIPKEDWRQLSVYIKEKFPDSHFQFQLAPTETKVQKIDPAELQAVPSSRCFTSNDPDYLAEKLLKLYDPEKKGDAFIIDLTSDLTVSELLVSITPGKSAAKEERKASNQDEVLFTIKKRAVFKALEADKTVILNGTLSPRLQQEFAALFLEKPYLEFNNERIAIKEGRLISVQPKSAPPAIFQTTSCDFTDKDYEQDLLKENKEEFKSKEAVVKKLLLFFKAAQYPHRGQAMPKDFGMNWERLYSMQQVLLRRKRHLHSHNPIKGLMLDDYTTDSEYYAFLNVMCKFLFDYSEQGPNIRLEKFKEIPKDQNHAWRLLNTCDGKTLRALLGEEWLDQSSTSLFDSWTSETWSKMFEKLKEREAEASSAPERKSASIVKTDLDQYSKMKERLDYLIDEDQFTKFIVLKGEPGVGKTHVLNELQQAKKTTDTAKQDEVPLVDDQVALPEDKTSLKYRCYAGLDQIGKWLKDPADKIKLLLLDEVNIHDPELLHLLKAIKKNRPIFFRGKFYPSAKFENCKIVAAVNPEWYSGRHYHELLRFYGETVQFKMPDKEYLRNYLTGTMTQEIAELALIGADLYKKYEPLISYSMRDLQDLMQLYKVLAKGAEHRPKVDLLFEALCGEFALRIEEPAKQSNFRRDLIRALNLNDSRWLEKTAEPFQLDGRLFPAELQDAKQAITQALLIRNHVLTEHKGSNANLAFKRCVLLQGAAGCGKLRLIESMLKQHNTPYLTVTAGAPNFRAVVDYAHQHGYVLIIEKFNFLEPKDEKHLGQRLTEINDENPGFLVLAQQNFSTEKGSAPLSPALCNRSQIITVPPFSPASWTALAQQQLENSFEAEALVKAFLHPRQHPYKHPLNAHDFFRLLQQLTVSYRRIYTAALIGVCGLGLAAYGVVVDYQNDFGFLTSNTPVLNIPNYASVVIGLSVIAIAAAAYKIKQQHSSPPPQYTTGGVAPACN